MYKKGLMGALIIEKEWRPGGRHSLDYALILFKILFWITV